MKITNIYKKLFKMTREEFSEYCYTQSKHCHDCPFKSSGYDEFNKCEEYSYNVLQKLQSMDKYTTLYKYKPNYPPTHYMDTVFETMEHNNITMENIKENLPLSEEIKKSIFIDKDCVLTYHQAIILAEFIGMNVDFLFNLQINYVFNTYNLKGFHLLTDEKIDGITRFMRCNGKDLECILVNNKANTITDLLNYKKRI